MSDDIVPDGDPEVNRQIDEALGRKIPLPQFIKSAESVLPIESQFARTHSDMGREYELAKLIRDNERLRAENERLKRGDFTEDEFQNLCHKLGDSDACRFADGCIAYWQQLFGKDKAHALIEQRFGNDRLLAECHRNLKSLNNTIVNMLDETACLHKHLSVAVDFVSEFVTSGVEFEDERIGYKVLQVPNALLADAEVWLKAMKIS